MITKVGQYTLVDYDNGFIGFTVYDDNGCCVGSVDNITPDDVDVDMLEEMLFGDLEEDECFID